MFSDFVRSAKDRRVTLIQPRMGWGSAARMRQGLLAVKGVSPRCVGTITLDSYTRVGDYASSLGCLADGQEINGYPIVSHPCETTRSLLAQVSDKSFVVQIRHGCAQPQMIFRRILDVGLDATEGGPVSYCLPYGRIPLAVAVQAWEESCRILSDGTECAHVESFGGCLLGQLCPPSLLVAMSVLECLFFREHGINSVSLSYAQGPCFAQDRAALTLLRDLARQHLADVDWHRVVYTYMGLFPASRDGALRLICDSADLVHKSGCERLIVKTRAERRRIPALDENLQAIRAALEVTEAPAIEMPLNSNELALYEELSVETLAILDAVMNLDSKLSRALPLAFEKGLLDVPYCLHPDNRGKTRAAIDEGGRLRWVVTGKLPFKTSKIGSGPQITSSTLLSQLSFVADRYDRTAARERWPVEALRAPR
jgi:methylaspartate mutase epsilon subunit